MASTPPSVAPNSPVRDRTTGSVNGMAKLDANYGLAIICRLLPPPEMVNTQDAKPFVRCAVSRKLLSSRNSFLITPTPGWDQEEAIRPLAKTRGKRAANRWQSTRLHKGDRP